MLLVCCSSPPFEIDFSPPAKKFNVGMRRYPLTGIG
jgi:hypothetical protein